MNIPETHIIENLKSEIASLRTEVCKLKEQIDWFKRQIFGQRSEKFVDPSPNQLTLFEFPPLPQKEKIVVSPHQRSSKDKSTAPISFPENLPVERRVYDLNEKQKICPETGKALVKIGEDISQKLAYKPGSYFIKETIRPKYAMPKGSEEGIVVADLPDSIISKCKADESLLAEILVKKFSDHLPLYRQSEIFARDHIIISRQTLSNWTVKCGMALKPLYNELVKEVLSSSTLFIDEVPVDMLKPGKGQTHQAYMWVVVGGNNANPALRIYNFRKNRSYSNAADLLKDYRGGIVHSDKYGAYETLANKKLFTWCPCWAHIRRKFYEAQGGDARFVQLVLRKIKYLFMLERIAWKRSEEERLRIRQEKEVPIIDELIRLVKAKFLDGSALSKSKFKEALGYFAGLIPYMKNFTLNACARLDNNVAERAVRPLALGRKNWLFLGSEEGGEAAAVILSLVQTCKALNINPREYLEDVMRRQMSHSNQKLDQLLPHKWTKKLDSL